MVGQKYFVMCSQGCCGSMQVRNCLQKVGLERIWMDETEEIYQNTHVRYPPKNFDICKVLYVYGDPRNILLSATNRKKLEIDDFWKEHCFNIRGDTRYHENLEKVTIDQLLQDNYDPLKLEEHFMNWLNVDANYPLMMLKYEALREPKIFQMVLDFFEIKEEIDYGWRPRETSYLKLPLEQQIQITKLFANLLKIQAGVPPVHIR